MIDELDTDDFEAGITSVFWREVSARLASMRRRAEVGCYAEGATERRADFLRGQIELLNVILGADTRGSLPDGMLAEARKEQK